MSQLANALDTLRHSTAHILAQAVLKKYPTAKLGIGPAIENGFYYDFELDTSLTDSDLQELEGIMQQIIAEDQGFTCFTQTRAETESRLAQTNQPYKEELVRDLDLDEYSFYANGPFIELCRGPHIQSTKQVKAFKLLHVSGAYWKGAEKNPMLQRIYGTAFSSQKELKQYLHRLEEAKKRDHRKLGKALNLFSIQEDIGGGLILWHPKGASIRSTIEQYWKDTHAANGYDLVYTPHVGKAALWETSGHLSFYKENMYQEMSVERHEYYLRPMNCPFHIMIYNASTPSYRQLPVRYAELGTVYRYERSGVLHGLFRVRGFTQDDAHIICTQQDVATEIERALRFSLQMLNVFGFKEFKLYLSTKPKEKYVGDPDQWLLAEKALKEAIIKLGHEVVVDEGGGAFYGPKIDIKIEDAIGRTWQCSTIQFDFNLPTQFDMAFINSKGEKERPYMIHRALLGSLERFFGILIEHYAGWFPAWLAPVQCSILTVSSTVDHYAERVKKTLEQEGIRVSLDTSAEKIGYKVRQHSAEKVPYLLIIGEKEAQIGSVAIRHKKEQLGTVAIETFIETYKEQFKPIELTK